MVIEALLTFSLLTQPMLAQTPAPPVAPITVPAEQSVVIPSGIVLPSCPAGFTIVYTPGRTEYQCFVEPNTWMDKIVYGSLCVEGGMMAGDITTTILALQTGAKEQNPFLKYTIEKHPVGTMVAKGALTTASILAANRLRIAGKKKLSLAVSMFTNVVLGYAMYNNMKVYDKRNKELLGAVPTNTSVLSRPAVSFATTW